jgi:photosystem II stability/assembly factor-like uncharacterized protein
MNCAREGFFGGVALAALLWLAPAAAREPPPRYVAQVINPELNGSLAIPRSNVLLTYGSDAIILRSVDGLQWSHAATPGTSDLARIASNDQGTVQMAVGQAATLLRSTDAGQTWKAPRSVKVETDLRAVVNVPGSTTWLAAGTRGRILRSADDGKSWTLVESGLTAEFHALYHDSVTRTVLIGGENGLVGFSQDLGLSWQLTAITMPEPVTPVTAFHRFGKLLLGTSALGRFLVSTDDARSWDLLQASTQPFFTGAAFDPGHSSIVMTGHNGDVLRSIDGGQSWQGGEVVVDGRKGYLSAIHYDARSKSLLIAGQGGVLARSTDGGANWQQASQDLHGELRGLVEHDGRLVVFGTGGAIATSTDSGAKWNYSRENLDLGLREIAPAAKGTALIASGRLGEIIRSTDSGLNWTPVRIDYPNPNTPPDLRALLLSPSGEALLAMGPPGAILRSNEDGSVWQVRHWTDIEAERALPWGLVDARRKLVVAVEARGAMQVSPDDGRSWVTHGNSLPAGSVPFWQGAVLENAGVMVVAGDSGRALRSADEGRTWEPVDTGSSEHLYGSYADENRGVLFLMGAKGTMLRSTDLGQRWSSVSTGSDQELRRMLRDPQTGALLCFGTFGTVLRSQDDGLTWKKSATGTDGVLRKGLVEPRTGNLLLAGSRGALLRSTDGGRRWETIATHTTHHFNSIAADKQTGDLVLVGDRIVRLVRQSSR